MKRVNVVAKHQKRIAPASGAQMREELKNVEVPSGHDWNPATLWNQCPTVTILRFRNERMLLYCDSGRESGGV
jgi:hypothetical protein